jgi:hypothetical protein
MFYMQDQRRRLKYNMDIKVICKEDSCYWNVHRKDLNAEYLCSVPEVILQMFTISKPIICKTYVDKEKANV